MDSGTTKIEQAGRESTTPAPRCGWLAGRLCPLACESESTPAASLATPDILAAADAVQGTDTAGATDTAGGTDAAQATDAAQPDDIAQATDAAQPEDTAQATDASQPQDTAPADTSTSKGACDNAADLAALATSDPSKTISGCVTSCLSPSAGCNSCLAKGLGTSASCTGCFASIVDCTVKNCALNCISPNSKACTDCQSQKCFPAFVACSGVSPP